MHIRELRHQNLPTAAITVAVIARPQFWSVYAVEGCWLWSDLCWSNLLLLQYAFNLFSHNSSMDPELGYNEEEMKMIKETKKIWGTNDVAITATCIRVPVMRAHAESINLEFDRDVDEAEALDVLSKFPGVSIIDDR